MKSCSRCGAEKELGEFGRDKRATDGRKSECLVCQRKQSAAYYKTPAGKRNAAKSSRRYRERHPEKAKTSRIKNYYKDHEKTLAAMRKWRSENVEKARSAERRWAKANRQRKLEIQQKYAKRHPEKVRANARRQEMRRRGEGDDPSPETREYLEIIHHDPCCFCGGPKEHIEHIEPRDRWDLEIPGWNQWPNLSAACQPCNNRKSKRSLLTFMLSELSGDPERPPDKVH